MRPGAGPAVLGLLLLCAAGAGAGDAEELHYPQGEHRGDFDREALLGGQVRRPGPGRRAPRALSRAGPGRGGLAVGTRRGSSYSRGDPEAPEPGKENVAPEPDPLPYPPG